MQPIHYVPMLDGERQAEVLRAFVRAGASLDAKDYSGWTVLHHIAECGPVEAAEVLVEAGARCRIRSDAPRRGGGGQRPSEVAAARGRSDMAAYLGREEERERLQG